MLDISKCDSPISKPQKAIEEKTDLELLESKNDILRREIFKWFILVLIIVGIASVAICFIWKFFTVETIQKYILNQIINNFVFIIVSVFAILKINIPTSN